MVGDGGVYGLASLLLLLESLFFYTSRRLRRDQCNKCMLTYIHTLDHYRERGKTKLVYLLHTDLKGKVPTKIVEAALPDMQLSYFSNLCKIIKESAERT